MELKHGDDDVEPENIRLHIKNLQFVKQEAIKEEKVQ